MELPVQIVITKQGLPTLLLPGCSITSTQSPSNTQTLIFYVSHLGWSDSMKITHWFSVGQMDFNLYWPVLIIIIPVGITITWLSLNSIIQKYAFPLEITPTIWETLCWTCLLCLQWLNFARRQIMEDTVATYKLCHRKYRRIIFFLTIIEVKV